VKINIPVSQRVKVLRFLDRFKLNTFSLFDSEESLMEMLAFRTIDLGRRSMLRSDPDENHPTSAGTAPTMTSSDYGVTGQQHTRERVANICPECGYQFKGTGFDGTDSHWKANHEDVVPYKEHGP
jgi:hypothetical protein